MWRALGIPLRVKRASLSLSFPFSPSQNTNLLLFAMYRQTDSISLPLLFSRFFLIGFALAYTLYVFA